MDDAITWRHDVSGNARVLSGVMRLIVKPILSVCSLIDRGINAIAHLDRMVDRLPQPKRVTIERVTLGGARRVRRPRTPARRLVGRSHGAVLPWRRIRILRIGNASERLRNYRRPSRVPVYFVKYRQIPHGGVGTSISDAMCAYRADLQRVDDPTKIVVAGDSVGGYLAMKVAELAAMAGLTPTVAVRGFSPLLNLDLKTYPRSFINKDAYLPMNRVFALEDRWLNGPDAIPGPHRRSPPTRRSISRYFCPPLNTN